MGLPIYKHIPIAVRSANTLSQASSLGRIHGTHRVECIVYRVEGNHTPLTASHGHIARRRCAHPPNRLWRAFPRLGSVCSAGSQFRNTDAASADPIEATATEFHRLIGPSGVQVGDPDLLELREGEYGRGIFVHHHVRAGSVLLAVPLSLCLRAHRDEMVSVPSGEWADLIQGRVEGWPRLQTQYAEYPLPWEARLATALMDAAEGGAAGSFWGEYARLLPPPTDAPALVAFTEAAARGLQHPALELERNQDRSRLGQLCPDLLPQNSAPGSTDASTVLEGPSLEWAVACARSRAFQGGADVFCIVPFVDMVNHSFNAVNAKVQLRVTDSDVLGALMRGDGVFELSASVDIAADTEVMVSYGCSSSSNQQLISRYGFVRPDNPYDRLSWELPGPDSEVDIGNSDGDELENGDFDDSEWEEAGDWCISGELLDKALKQKAEEEGYRWLRLRAGSNRLKAALASIPLHTVSLKWNKQTRLEETEATEMLLTQAEHMLKDFDSSYAQDEVLLLSLQNMIGSDQQETVVRYRMERKALIQQVIDVLVTYNNFLTVSC